MIETIPFQKWPRALRLSNDVAELMVTLDVGPRILSFRHHGGPNPFCVYPEQAGTQNDAEWRIRGGHRLWVAPEHPVDTYRPDNAPVAWEAFHDHAVRLTAPNDSSTGLQKEIDLTLDADAARVTVLHRLIRTGSTPVTVAPWALTVMAAGGTAVLPQPPLGSHPRDLQPNRKLVLWPYTSLADPRWIFGERYILLRHDPARGPTKIGFGLPGAWCGYLLDGTFFLKQFSWQPDASYADGGCNAEVFANPRMLELESLGPLRTLNPGDTIEHLETWSLHTIAGGAGEFSEAHLHAALAPVIGSLAAGVEAAPITHDPATISV